MKSRSVTECLLSCDARLNSEARTLKAKSANKENGCPLVNVSCSRYGYLFLHGDEVVRQCTVVQVCLRQGAVVAFLLLLLRVAVEKVGEQHDRRTLLELPALRRWGGDGVLSSFSPSELAEREPSFASTSASRSFLACVTASLLLSPPPPTHPP